MYIIHTKRIINAMNNIKPIETRYRGYRCRSRLEARWMVFFDALGIVFEYEREGFELPDGRRYLPDFWLPQVKMWAEVKPFDFSPAELSLASELVKRTGFRCLMLVGSPDLRSYSEVPGVSGENFATDYIVNNDYLNEGRFYSSTGFERNDDPDLRDNLRLYPGYIGAIEAARSARFEFGESGAA